MKKLVTGVVLAALLGAAPVALAKNKSAEAMKGQGAEQSSTEENANRLKNEDGTFQGKPVVQGPANWADANSSASSGSSSGEGGASSSDMPRSGSKN